MDDAFGETALMKAAEDGLLKVMKVLTETTSVTPLPPPQVCRRKAHRRDAKRGQKINAKDTSKSRIGKKKRQAKLKAPKKIIHPMTLGWFMFLLAGLFMLISPFYKKLTCTNETIAEVVNVEQTGGGGSDGISYRPTFSYNVNGEQIIMIHDVSMYPKPYEIGDTLTLFYNPNKPESYNGRRRKESFDF